MALLTSDFEIFPFLLDSFHELFKTWLATDILEERIAFVEKGVKFKMNVTSNN